MIYSAATGRFQTLATSGTASTSTAIAAGTVMILSGKVGHYIAIGADPTATTASFYLPADNQAEFQMTNSTSTKISVMAESSTGVVTIAY